MTTDGKSISFALSGGGYRATLFGLGSLWRINDAHLLGRLDRITSVSGGSITLGVLFRHWRELEFADGKAKNFQDLVADPIRRFCGTTIDLPAALKGIFLPIKSPGQHLTDHFRKHLFGDFTLGELSRERYPHGPTFIFYATNMQTGRRFRFSQDFIADYYLGVLERTDVPLPFVVAASNAFPPFLSPVVLKTDPERWNGGLLPNATPLRKRIVLTDGGIYDNLGLEALSERVDVELVSDAGLRFRVRPSLSNLFVPQLRRVSEILVDQTRSLRRRWLIEDFRTGKGGGAYWGIGTPIESYGVANPLAKDDGISRSLEEIPTRLSSVEPETQRALVNWGYALCDAALRTSKALNIQEAAGLPLP